MSSSTMSMSRAFVPASEALLCSTSSPPNASTAVPIMRTTLASSETSTSAGTAFSSSPATRSASARLMSATTTEAPSPTITRAVASPMPLPAAERDVADDRIPRHRRAALRQAHEHVLDADDVDAIVRAGERVARLRPFARSDRLFLGDLFGLQPLQDLVDDAPGRELARAERDIELLRLLEAGLADDAGKDGRPGELAVREVLPLQRVLERLAALRLEVLLLLAREELADLVARARRLDERQPVA